MLYKQGFNNVCLLSLETAQLLTRGVGTSFGAVAKLDWRLKIVSSWMWDKEIPGKSEGKKVSVLFTE